jgi:hypothetical protein
MRTGLLRYLGVLLIAGVLGGCAEDEPRNGVLVVPFKLGNGRSCEDLGIVAVRGELNGGEYEEEIDCSAGQVRFTLLPAGRFEVTLYAIDDDGFVVMDSLTDATTDIDVVGGGTTVVFDPAVKLTASPAQMKLRWQFGFGSCESSQIDRFAIAAWREDGSELLMESEIACDVPGEGRGQYRLVPDLERELSGDELGEIEIQPIDVNDLSAGDPVVFDFEPPGPGREVKLSLTCNTSGCEGSGALD